MAGRSDAAHRGFNRRFGDSRGRKDRRAEAKVSRGYVRTDPLETRPAPTAAAFDHPDVQGPKLGHRLDRTFKADRKLVMESWEVCHHVRVHEGGIDERSGEVDPATARSTPTRPPTAT